MVNDLNTTHEHELHLSVASVSPIATPVLSKTAGPCTVIGWAWVPTRVRLTLAAVKVPVRIRVSPGPVSVAAREMVQG